MPETAVNQMATWCCLQKWPNPPQNLRYATVTLGKTVVGGHYCDISGSIRNKLAVLLPFKWLLRRRRPDMQLLAASWRLWFVIEWDKVVWRHVASHQATCGIVLQPNRWCCSLQLLVTEKIQTNHQPGITPKHQEIPSYFSLLSWKTWSMKTHQSN